MHAIVFPPERDIDGTDVILDGITESQIEAAKRIFLQFTDDELLEETKFGAVYATPEDGHARIYVSGLRVATEENFLFSYNITNTTKQVRDALNRERSNVGRTAYSARVKDILQECESTAVAQRLVDDFKHFTDGTTRDEVNWKPIRLHAVRLLNAQEDVVLASAEEQQHKADLVDHAKREGLRVVTVPENIRDELRNERDAEGNDIRDLGVYRREYNESHEYEWFSEEAMTPAERRVWDRRHDILELIGLQPEIESVRISETIRMTEQGDMARGVWEGGRGRIVIRRDRLESLSAFASTFLHETAHARTNGAADLTRRFEDALTELLGEVADSALADA